LFEYAEFRDGVEDHGGSERTQGRKALDECTKALHDLLGEL